MPEKKNELVGRKIRAVPKDKVEVGVDDTGYFVKNLLGTGDSLSGLDTSVLQGFSTTSQTRETLYGVIDQMSEDSRVASVLETYTEDATETNDKGHVIWCESSDKQVTKYVTRILDSINVDKNAYGWTFSLIKYGDLYIKLFRKSKIDEENSLFNDGKDTVTDEQKRLNEKFNRLHGVDLNSLEDKVYDPEKAKKEALKEDINVIIPTKGDHYVQYVEAVDNPGEMFDLTRYGKTYAYIQAPTRMQQVYNSSQNFDNFLRYKIKKGDVNIFYPTEFVHACLIDNTSRSPEEVTLFQDDKAYSENKNGVIFKVKRGQSMLANSFRTWREMSLLENSVLLNRLTRAAVTQAVQVEVGNMNRNKVMNHIADLKRLFKTKTAIDEGKGLSEYVNPGPVENKVFIPTKNGIGALKIDTLGGTDYDPKQLTDLDYFNRKLYGSWRMPRNFLGENNDGAGFDGGKSLSIVSSRYGKAIKRIQNIMCQLVTDIVHLFLLDRGMEKMINKFTIRMQTPVTQAEIDKREAENNKMRVVTDLMNTVTDLPSAAAKIKILKSLLSNVIDDPEVIEILQDQIKQMEKEESASKNPEPTEGGGDIPSSESSGGDDFSMPSLGGGEEPSFENEPSSEATPEEGAPQPEGSDDDYLPTPEEIGLK